MERKSSGVVKVNMRISGFVVSVIGIQFNWDWTVSVGASFEGWLEKSTSTLWPALSISQEVGAFRHVQVTVTCTGVTES